VLATVTAGVLNYAYTLTLLHLLPVGPYTVFASGQALLLTVGSVAQCAVPWVLAHELTTAGADPVRRCAAVSFAALANAAGGLAAALPAALVATQFAAAQGTLVIAASVVAVFLSNTTIGWLQGERRFGLLALLTVGEVVVKIVVGLGLVLAGFRGAGALAGFAAGALFAVALGMVWMRHDLRPAPTMGHLRRSLRTTAAMTAMQGLLAVQANLDVLLVAVLPVQVRAQADYQAAAVLGRITVFVSAGLAVVLFPLVATARDRLGVLRAAMGGYALIAVGVTAALLTTPAGLFRLVIPGQFASSDTLLPLLAAGGLCTGAAGLVTAYLQAIERYRTAITAQAAGLAATALAIGIGWKADGTVGMAAGAAAGAFGTAVLLQVLAHQTWKRALPIPAWSLGLLAVLAGVLWSLRAHPVTWAAVTAAVGAACGYVLLRVRRPAAPPAPSPAPPSSAAPSSAPRSSAPSFSAPSLFAPSSSASPSSASPSSAPRWPAGIPRSPVPSRSPVAPARGAVRAATSVPFPGPYLFVSPHLDDCVLSCGALMSALPPGDVVVVTLFTAADPGPLSLSARTYLRQCEADDPSSLYQVRRHEDRDVLARLGAEAVHLGLTEALFRRHPSALRARAGRWLPDLALTYPTFRFHVAAGALSQHDEPLVHRAAAEIVALVEHHRPRTVLLPLGIGGHVDHLVTREIGRWLPDLAVYYADFPYSMRDAPDELFTRRLGLTPIDWHAGVAAKTGLIRGYRSQFPSLFPDGTVPARPERYFVPSRRLVMQ
jgi:O-antigen/teichoic acid export membrane protein/LmbE family N-acetylglucosaminyl deacetylase